MDGVLVGHGTATSDLRTEQLKRLVAERVSVLVVHPIFESVLPYYEIDMTRRESNGLVQHYNPTAELSILGQLGTWARDGHPELGRIHQVTCERESVGSNVRNCVSRFCP